MKAGGRSAIVKTYYMHVDPLTINSFVIESVHLCVFHSLCMHIMFFIVFAVVVHPRPLALHASRPMGRLFFLWGGDSGRAELLETIKCGHQM